MEEEEFSPVQRYLEKRQLQKNKYRTMLEDIKRKRRYILSEHLHDLLVFTQEACPAFEEDQITHWVPEPALPQCAYCEKAINLTHDS